MREYIVKDTLIQVKNVSVSFEGRPVLSDVNAEIKDIVRPDCIQGQVIGILGPSGVGKSVFSRVLTGLQKPTSGEVLVGAKGLPVEAGVVGFVSQHYPLFAHRTVLGNLVLAARRVTSDAKEAKEKAEAYLTKFDLMSKWDMYPSQLSGGQRQRVAIAQQLLCSEHYLVLDEPTTGLDPIMKDRVCELIKQVSCLTEENTIFVVSHDIPAVMSVADRLWLVGRKRDEKGESLGADIRYSYDLIERGIAWEEQPDRLPAFTDLAREIRQRFEEL